MPHRRLFRLHFDLNADEIYTRVQEIPNDLRNEANFLQRRRGHGTPLAMIIQVITPNPLDHYGRVRHRAMLAHNKILENTKWRRRPWSWKNFTELAIIGSLPPGAVLDNRLGVKRLQMYRSAADSIRRRRSIDRSKNELAFNYPHSVWSEAWGYVLDEIQRHVLEPYYNLGEFWYDNLWSRDEILDWLEVRVNEFLLKTGMVREQTDISIAANENKVTLPTNNEVRRAVWIDQSGATWPLELEDLQAQDAGRPGWQDDTGTPDTLLTWGRGRTAQLVPIPSAAGTLRIDYVPTWSPASPALNVQQSSSGSDWVGVNDYLPIPAVFAPYIKYGIMADMFEKEGEANDPVRARYCAKRWDEGIELARMLLGRSS